MKKRVVRNICQCIIGGILLCMSYNYVQAHDAERTNFISGIDVLKQKISSIMSSVMGQGSAADSQRQQDMIRDYKELLSFMRASKCVISVSEADIQTKLDMLYQITPMNYKQQALHYSSYASQVYDELQRCKK